MTLNIFRLISFLAAFLLFSIQPVMGKIILPFIGGAPQGWLVALAFFQTTLLAGYALVLLTQKLPPLLAGIAHIALLVFGIAVLDPHAPFDGSGTSSSFGVFIWLWISCGPAIVALGAMAPFAQRLFANFNPENPYKLYAVSNFGSFSGLLAYPFLFEPFSGISIQTEFWRYGYICLVALLALGIFCTRKKADTHSEAVVSPNVKLVLKWLAYAALPASMLSGVTTLISSNIVSFPLLWVLPLALYLASFIAAFRDGGDAKTDDRTFYFCAAVALLLAIAAIGRAQAIAGSMIIHLCLFAAAAYFCHRKAYELRPNVRHLPFFYLVIAAGGAAGGAFNAFLVPVLFDHTYEFHIALALTLPLFGSNLLKRRPPALTTSMRAALAVCVAAAAATPFLQPPFLYFLGPIIFVSCTVLLFRPWYAVAAFAVCLTFGVPHKIFGVMELQSLRNFFGVMRVIEYPDTLVRSLIHGTTMHGQQPPDDSFRGVPVSYYSKTGPAGQALESAPSGPLAVVGLGTGQMGCYADPKRPVTFLEIDPDIVTLAHRHFHYLRSCPPKEIVIGDARLSLRKDGEKYRGIVLDAFSSDAIPAHLLTAEAINIYKKRLLPDGFLLFHISNSYLDLAPILVTQAKHAGMKALYMDHKIDRHDQGARYDSPSKWMVLTENTAFLDLLSRKGWVVPAPDATVWTDDRFSVLEALRLPKPSTGEE